MFTTAFVAAAVAATPAAGRADSSPAPASACTPALNGVPAARACAATALGVALAVTQEEADRLIADATAGEGRFLRVFGVAPTRYAVFAFADPATIPATRATLRQLGFMTVLAMPSAAFLAQQRERAAASAALAGGRVVVRNPAATDEPRDPDNRDLIPHELGHLWYGQAFWADAPRAAGDRYGSAAPDWLDEAAAILMESDGRATMHHNRFADTRNADAERALALPREIPLAELVAMAHPASAGFPAPGQAAGPFRVTSAPSLFYPQSRLLADYLIERSGDPRIIARVSEGISKGATFADWLVGHGARHRLPASLAAMDADWQQWLAARFGPRT